LKVFIEGNFEFNVQAIDFLGEFNEISEISAVTMTCSLSLAVKLAK